MSNNVSQFGQNQWLVDEMYERFAKDPSSVDKSWHEFFDANPEAASSSGGDSTNGTSHNGERVAAPVPVIVGAPIKVGATTFELRK